MNHIIDPRTGANPRRYARVTVTAPVAATADALSTGLMLLEPPSVHGALQPDVTADVREVALACLSRGFAGPILPASFHRTSRRGLRHRTAPPSKSWRGGARLRPQHPEAEEGEGNRQQRIQQVEEAERREGGRRDAERRRHVGAAAVPGNQRRGDGGRIADGAGKHDRRETAFLEGAAEHPAGQHDGDVLVGCKHVRREGGADQRRDQRADGAAAEISGPIRRLRMPAFSTMPPKASAARISQTVPSMLSIPPRVSSWSTAGSPVVETKPVASAARPP